MAEILPFVRREPSRLRSERDGSGEVVIFTGVRVEYHDAIPAKPPKRRARRCKPAAQEGALTA